MIKRFEDVESHAWSERLYGLMHACIDMGFVNRACLPQVKTHVAGISSTGASSSGGAATAITQSSANDKAFTEKRQHQHGLHHGFCVYADI